MGTGFTPLYKIEKDGEDITGHFNDRCTQIRVDFDSGNGASDTATIALDDRDWRIARPNPGDKLKIWLGYAEVGLAYMGSFELDVVEFSVDPARTIQLKLNSTGQRDLYKSQTTMNLEGKSLQDIAQAMADKAGLQAVVNPKVGQITIPFLNVVTSPMQAVAEIGSRYGLVMKVVDGKLIATTRDAGESATGQTMPIVVLQGEHFGTVHVRHSQRTAYSHAFAAWTDPKDYVTRFERSDLKGPGLPQDVPFTIDRKYSSQAEAKAAAEAQAKVLQQGLTDADLQLAKGDPWISAQQRILIRGMRDGIDGSYVTDLVSHTYVKDQGILTAIKARSTGDGSDFEGIYDASSDEQKRSLFLQPGLGGLVGALFGLGGVPAAKATANDIINGVNPFAG